MGIHQDATSNHVAYIIIIPAIKPVIDDVSNQAFLFHNNRSLESSMGKILLDRHMLNY
jgi:hypothetical protein